MKIRSGESIVSSQIIFICILLAINSQVVLCVNAKKRTQTTQLEANAESLSQLGQINPKLNNDNYKKEDVSFNVNKKNENISDEKNLRKEQQNKIEKQERMGMVALLQKEMGVLKNVYQNYYSKLTIHLGSQKDLYFAIVSTIIIFSIVFMALANNKQDFPFLRNLDLQGFQSKAKLEKMKRQKEEDEQFYNSYNLSGSSNKSLNSEADSYLSQSDFKLQRGQVDILNSLEWQRMKDRAQKYSAFENSPLYQEFRMKSQQENKTKTKKIDETIDFNENNIDINDLLNELDNQSFIASKNSCNSSCSSNNPIVI